MSNRFDLVMTGVKREGEIDLDPHSWDIEAPTVRNVFKPPTGDTVAFIAECMTAGELDANVRALKEELDAIANLAKDALADEKRRLGHYTKS